MNEKNKMLAVSASLDNKYVAKVKSYATLGYSRERVCRLLGLTHRETTVLRIRLTLPGDEYYEAYEAGIAAGEMNIDSELAKQAENGDIDAIELLEERKNERYFKDLRKELFGI